MGSWCYSREWVWNLRTKLCLVASWKQSVLDTSMRLLRSSDPLKIAAIQIIVIFIRGCHLQYPNSLSQDMFLDRSRIS